MSEVIHDRPIEILLVEDRIEDATLTRVALLDGEIAKNICVVEDGVEALTFLRRQPPFTDAPRPDIIMLDINMPRKNGIETLAGIKNDQRLSDIPVIMLTTSSAESDIARCYALQANCYIVKPVGLDHFLDAIKMIEKFWFATVHLPPRQEVA